MICHFPQTGRKAAICGELDGPFNRGKKNQTPLFLTYTNLQILCFMERWCPIIQSISTWPFPTLKFFSISPPLNFFLLNHKWKEAKKSENMIATCYSLYFVFITFSIVDQSATTTSVRRAWLSSPPSCHTTKLSLILN